MRNIVKNLWVQIVIVLAGLACIVISWRELPRGIPLLGDGLQMIPKMPEFGCPGPPATRKIDTETRVMDDCDGDGAVDIVHGTYPVILSETKTIALKRWQEFLEGYSGILPPVRCPDGNEEKVQVVQKDAQLLLHVCGNQYFEGLANQVMWYGRDQPEGQRWTQAFKASP